MARRVPVPPLSSTQLGPPVGPSVGEAIIVVLREWETSALLTELSQDKMGRTVRRFGHRLAAEGVDTVSQVTPDHAAAFVTAPHIGGRPPQVATQHDRRAAVRCFFRTLRALGLESADPTLDLRLPSRDPRPARPLTDPEVAVVRTTAGAGPYGSARTAAWALGETGASTGEIPLIRIYDLDGWDQPAAVRLPGTRRQDPRTITLTDWGRRALAARVQRLTEKGASEDAPLAYTGSAPPHGQHRQASTCTILRVVLRAAGLGDDPSVRPSSLRHWAGRRLYESGLSIDQVARQLGYRSLDACAEDIHLGWRRTISTGNAR